MNRDERRTGDHPVSVICDYELPVFSTKANALVCDIDRYLPRDRIWNLFDWFQPPPLSEFEHQLEAKRDQLYEDAKERGWDAL
jgi:hypothetical protein